MSKKERTNIGSILNMIGNIVSWTFFVLLILVAGFLVYYIISSHLYASKGEKYAPKFSLYTIISPSMTPNINVYDIVIDERVDNPNDLKVGDVITFISSSSISNGMTITHRINDIIETEEGIQFKTKGDNNLTSDYALVAPNKIIGRVKFRIPQLGRVQFFLSSKGGWLVVVIIPAIMILFTDILKLLKVSKIKKRVQVVEENDKNEEEVSQEQLVNEYVKQQELKEKLQIKNNTNIHKKTKTEDEGFLLKTGVIELSVDREDELSRTQAINLDGLDELRNKILDEDEKYVEEPVEEYNDGFVEEYNTPEEEIEEEKTSDLFDEFVREIKSQQPEEYSISNYKSTIEEIDENVAEQEIFKEEPNNYEEEIVEPEEIIEEENTIEEPEEVVEEVQEDEDDDDELELPKLINFAEETIPDDIELPAMAPTKEKIVDIDVAKKVDSDSRLKVVGSIQDPRNRQLKRKV